jgi:hypothetical protein
VFHLLVSARPPLYSVGVSVYLKHHARLGLALTVTQPEKRDRKETHTERGESEGKEVEGLSQDMCRLVTMCQEDEGNYLLRPMGSPYNICELYREQGAIWDMTIVS